MMAVSGFAQYGQLSIRLTQDSVLFLHGFFSEKVVFLWNGGPIHTYDVIKSFYF